MRDYSIMLPSKPRVVEEKGNRGVYEIDNLYPGYGHTLGNSLRRIILSSLPGAAITTIKIDGANHEFTTINGMKEDVILLLLNLKKVRFKMTTDAPQEATISVKGAKSVTAADIETSGQLEVLNPEQPICEMTDKHAHLSVQLTVERGLGFVPRDVHHKQKVDIGVIALDALFTPIRRVAYEVENMRVGDKTNHNRLRIIIETDGSITPREALTEAVKTLIDQLRSIVEIPLTDSYAFSPEAPGVSAAISSMTEAEDDSKEDMSDVLKTRIDSLSFSTRTLNSLQNANIRTVGGLARKKEEDLLEIEGIGDKGIQEIRKILGDLGLSLK